MKKKSKWPWTTLKQVILIFLISSRLRDLEMLQFAIYKAKFDKILIVLNEIKEWEFESVLFWSIEASWARVADGKSLYHLGVIFRATVLLLPPYLITTFTFSVLWILKVYLHPASPLRFFYLISNIFLSTFIMNLDLKWFKFDF